MKTILSSLQKFGEKCIVAKEEKLKAKQENYAVPGIWLRYAKSHAFSTYQVLNPKTRQLMLTQDAIFEKKSYFH